MLYLISPVKEGFLYTCWQVNDMSLCQLHLTITDILTFKWLSLYPDTLVICEFFKIMNYPKQIYCSNNSDLWQITQKSLVEPGHIKKTIIFLVSWSWWLFCFGYQPLYLTLTPKKKSKCTIGLRENCTGRSELHIGNMDTR